MDRRQITLKDIARELKLSPSTVSRALRNHPAISKETKRWCSKLLRSININPTRWRFSCALVKTKPSGLLSPKLYIISFPPSLPEFKKKPKRKL